MCRALCSCPQAPDHVAGTLSEGEAPVANVKPVEDIVGRPAAVRVPGQTVYGQLFLTTKVTD
jgi:hypothetical protein